MRGSATHDEHIATDINTPLRDAFEQFLRHLGTAKPSPHTITGYRYDLIGVARTLPHHVAGSDDVENVTVGDLTHIALAAGFADWAAPRAPATVRRAHSAWRQFTAWLLTQGAVTADPMLGIRKPKKPDVGKVRSITTDDVARLIAATRNPPPRQTGRWPERDLAITATLASTGIRLSELTRLTSGSITNRDDGAFLTVTGKGSRTRTIPITDGLATAIDAYLADRDDRFPDSHVDRPATPLLVTVTGGPMNNRRVQYLVAQLFDQADVVVPHGGALVHALRHTFASEALRSGANIHELQTLLGHKSLEATQHYLSTQPDQLRRAIEEHPTARLVNQT